jgi:periplasmic protein TonB
VNGLAPARSGWVFSERSRWFCSFAVVVGLHGGATLAALNWNGADIIEGAAPAALLIDMVAVASAPDFPQSQPVPEPSVATPAREPPPVVEPESVVRPEPEVELPTPPIGPAHEAAVEPTEEAAPREAFDADPFDVTPLEPAQQTLESSAVHAAKPAQDVLASPPAMPAPAAATAPQHGESILIEGSVATWQALLLAHLEKHKRYPREAQWMKQEGVVELYFTMDREGRVLDARIEQSAQSSALDREALALLVRAEPLPLPPEAAPDATFELIVPIEFALKR